MTYMICGLDANDCREVVRTRGRDDGTILGYVIRREDRWYAYRLNAANDLVFLGNYATDDEAAKRIGW